MERTFDEGFQVRSICMVALQSRPNYWLLVLQPSQSRTICSALAANTMYKSSKSCPIHVPVSPRRKYTTPHHAVGAASHLLMPAQALLCSI